MLPKISRRQFVYFGFGTMGFSLAIRDSLSHANASQYTAERDWRFCGSCNVLFHNRSGRGTCSKNPKGHSAAGFVFIIRYTDGCLDDAPKYQSQWRKCSKCLTMFYNGQGGSKLCPAGGSHLPDRAKCYYLLVNRLNGPVLNPENKFNQGGWRFCGRCSAMFFDGYLDNKGVCPSGGAHAALGDMFVLEHS